VFSDSDDSVAFRIVQCKLPAPCNALGNDSFWNEEMTIAKQFLVLEECRNNGLSWCMK
jgi:hypothetical protein